MNNINGYHLPASHPVPNGFAPKTNGHKRHHTEANGQLNGKKVKPLHNGETQTHHKKIPAPEKKSEVKAQTASPAMHKLYHFLKSLDSPSRPHIHNLIVECDANGGPDHLLTITELNLNHCKLTSLPEEVGHLTKIKILSLMNNKLTTLPPSLISLAPSLYKMKLEGNQFEKLPRVIWDIFQWRENHKKYFEIFLWENPKITVLPEELEPYVRTPPDHRTQYYRIEELHEENFFC